MKDERKKQASRRVLKKLSAVRAVLSKDEREVLDAIVLGEVRAHQVISKTPDQPAENEETKPNQIAPRRKGNAAMAMPNHPISKSSNKSSAKSQVKAHQMGPKGALKSNAKSTYKAGVKAHTISPKSTYKSNAKSNLKAGVKAHTISPKSTYKSNAKSTYKAGVKAHTVSPKSTYKSNAKSNLKAGVKAHTIGPKSTYKSNAKSNLKAGVKAHQMETPAEQTTVTTVPPIELPKVEFDPTAEQYKPIPE